VNVGKRTITARIQIFDGSGTNVDDSSDFSLDPGAAMAWTHTVRASGVVYTFPGADPLASIPAQ
jgi:O-succinylbenzoate synthase